MTDQTALVPAIEIQAAVYMTAQRRAIRELIKLKRALMDFMNGGAFKDAAAGIDQFVKDIRTWMTALRRAHSRTAKHCRKRRETFVTKSTPVERRVYADRKPSDPWSRQVQTRINNARIINTNAEGPLAP